MKKVLVSDKMAPEAIEIFKNTPGIEVDVKTGLTPDQLKEVVATGASDEEIGEWIAGHSQVKNADDVLKWNNKLRDMRLSEMSLEAQQYLEEYIPKVVPNHRPVYVWFDVYDLEEKRL